MSSRKKLVVAVESSGARLPAGQIDGLADGGGRRVSQGGRKGREGHLEKLAGPAVPAEEKTFGERCPAVVSAGADHALRRARAGSVSDWPREREIAEPLAGSVLISHEGPCPIARPSWFPRPAGEIGPSANDQRAVVDADQRAAKPQFVGQRRQRLPAEARRALSPRSASRRESSSAKGQGGTESFHFDRGHGVSLEGSINR